MLTIHRHLRVVALLEPLDAGLHDGTVGVGEVAVRPPAGALASGASSNIRSGSQGRNVVGIGLSPSIPVSLLSHRFPRRRLLAPMVLFSKSVIPCQGMFPVALLYVVRQSTGQGRRLRYLWDKNLPPSPIGGAQAVPDLPRGGLGDLVPGDCVKWDHFTHHPPVASQPPGGVPDECIPAPLPTIRPSLPCLRSRTPQSPPRWPPSSRSARRGPGTARTSRTYRPRRPRRPRPRSGASRR